MKGLYCTALLANIAMIFAAAMFDSYAIEELSYYGWIMRGAVMAFIAANTAMAGVAVITIKND